MDDIQINDENAFDHNGIHIRGKGADDLNDCRNFDKNPLKPLNNASRLSGNMKVWKMCAVDIGSVRKEKTPHSSPSTCVRQIGSAERLNERKHAPIKEDVLNTAEDTENVLKKLVGALPIDGIGNTWVSSAVKDDDTIPAKSEMDDLSDLLEGLDIKQTSSYKDVDQTSNDCSATVSLNDQDPLDKDNENDVEASSVKEFESVDDEIQFGIPVLSSPDSKNPSCRNEADDTTQSYDEEISFGCRVPELIKTGNEDIMGSSENTNENHSDGSHVMVHQSDMSSVDSFQGKPVPSPVKDTEKEHEECIEENIEDPFATRNKVTNSPNGNKEESMKIVEDFTSNESLASQANSANSPVKVLDSDDRQLTQCNDDEEISFACKASENINSGDEEISAKNTIMNSMQPDGNDASMMQGKIVNSPSKVLDDDGGSNKILCGNEDDEISFTCKVPELSEPIDGEIQGISECTDENVTQNSENSVVMQSQSEIQGSIIDVPVDILCKDPFKTESIIVNSPAKTSGEDSVECASESKIENPENPFATLSKVVNSPLLSKEEPMESVEDLKMGDPFSTKNNIVNSPLKTEDMTAVDPFSTQSEISNSPLLNKECPAKVDPYLEQEDPFSTKQNIMNSPTENKDLNTNHVFATHGETDNSLAMSKDDPMECVLVEEKTHCSLEIEDPFSTISKIVNSPVLAKNESEHSVEVENAADCSSDRCLDIEDPFSTISKIVNSPVENKSELSMKGDTVKNKSEHSIEHDGECSTNKYLGTQDPFSTKSKVVNSPVKNENEVPVKEDTECSADKGLDTQDPFSTKSKIVNSPLKNESEVPVKGETDFSTDQYLDTQDPFSTKSMIVNSPLKNESEVPMKGDTDFSTVQCLDTQDPFSTKSKVVNSPVKNESEVPVKEDTECSADKGLDTQDPFSTKSKIVNSPLKNESEVAMKGDTDFSADLCLDTQDPFSTKSMIVNSPVKNESEVPMKGDADFSAVQCLDTQDPFSTKSKVVNSPVKNESEVPMKGDTDFSADQYFDTQDPFSTKSMIVNSPLKNESEVPMKGDTDFSADQYLDTQDPFSTKSMIVNSPVKNESEVPMKGDADFSAVQCLDTQDPFSTKSKVVNSPVKNESEVPMKGDTDFSADQYFDTQDPFSTKSMIVNSPLKNESEVPMKGDTDFSADQYLDTQDPFSTKSMIVNSPVKNESEVPMKGDADFSAVQCLDTQDPFSTKSKVVNSPVKNESEVPVKEDTECSADKGLDTQDPFSTKSKIVNSPLKNESEVAMKGDTDFSADLCLDTQDPFSTKSMIVNSPVKNESEVPLEGNTDFSVDKFLDAVDPFSTKSNILNSPIKGDDVKAGVNENPSDNNLDMVHSSMDVNNDAQYANFPDEDLRKNDTQLTRVNEIENKIQPAGVESSDEEDDDDFKSFENSPVKDLEEELWNVKSPLIDSPREKTVAADLFQAKNSISHSFNDKGPSSDGCPVALESPHRVKETKKASLNIDDLVMAMKSEGLCKGKDGDLSQRNEINNAAGGSVTKDCEPMDLSNHLPEENIETEAIITDNVISDDFKPEGDINKSNLPEESQSNEQIMDFAFVKPKPVKPKEVEQTLDTQISQAGGVTIGNSQPNMAASSGPVTDDIDDWMFVNAEEAFESSGILDKLEKDFGTEEMARNLNRGSVLLKFDPLAEMRGSPKRPPRVSEIFKGSSAPSDDGVCLFGTPPKKVTRRPGLNTRVPGIAKESIEEESPAHEVDMMLNLEAHEVMKEPHNNNFSNATPRLVDIGAVYTEADFSKLKMDLTLHYEERLLQKDRDYEKQQQEKSEEHAKELAELKDQINTLVEEKAKFSTKADSFKTKLLKNKTLFEDYAHLIAKLSDENKMLESKLSFLTQECTQVKEDNKKLDKSFDDLFHRYEKMKSTLVQCAENEAALKKSLEQSLGKYKEKVEAMKNMKDTAETKISEQEEQIEKLNSSNKAELAKIEVVLKRKEMEMRSLKDSLERKKAENVELTDLCDSLINKVSGK